MDATDKEPKLVAAEMCLRLKEVELQRALADLATAQLNYWGLRLDRSREALERARAESRGVA